MSRGNGGCLNCGGYCDLHLCSPACAEAYGNRNESYSTKCLGCGAEDHPIFSAVYRKCGPCMDADRTIDQTNMPPDKPERNEWGEKI